MNVYYYCNYAYSAAGFNYAGLNTRGSFSLDTDEAKDVIRFLGNGGAESMIGKLSNGKAFFMIKKIKKTVEGVSAETTGSRWDINLALTAEEDETADLCACAYFAYTDITGFGDALMRSLRVDMAAPEGYAIDSDAFLQMLEQARVKYTSGGDTQDACIAVPQSMAGQDLTPVLQLLKQQDIHEPFSFVALSADLPYFRKMYRLDPSASVRLYLPKKAGASEKEPFEKIPTQQKISDLLKDEGCRKKIAFGAAATAAVAAAVAAVAAVKIIKKYH